MLTKEQIESMHTLLVRERPMGTSVAAVDELCRLALLGLESEERRARFEAAAESEKDCGSAVLADSFGAFPDLGLGPDLDLGPEPHEAPWQDERDERAERIGRAVLADCALTRFAIETAIDTIRNGDGFDDDDIPKLRAIADAMEEP